jgi:hypothetical protein
MREKERERERERQTETETEIETDTKLIEDRRDLRKIRDQLYLRRFVVFYDTKGI